MYLESITIKIIDTFNNNRTMIVEQTAVGAPKLVYNGADDKYQPIMTSEFTFNMVVTDKTDGKYFHLYTGNEKRYKVVVEDHLGVMFYEGFLLPDFYEEPYTNGVFFVNLTSTDGVALLKGRHLPNVYYRQETSVIKLIAECLKLTGLEKEIHFSPAILSAVTDYRWDEIVVDGSCYLEGEIKYGVLFIELMPNRKSAYDILADLLESIGCTLYSQAGVWYIEGINRKHEVTQDYLKYTYDGVYVGDYIVTKDVNDVVFFTTPNISIVSPWKRIDISWSPDENGNLLTNDAIEYKGAFMQTGTPALDGPLNPQNQNPLQFWKTNGNITADLTTKEREYYVDWSIPGTIAVPTPVAPFSLRVTKQYVSFGPYDVDGETEAGTAVNFLSFKKPYYLKTSDEYIERSLKFSMQLHSEGLFDDAIDDRRMEFVYRYDVMAGTDLVMSSRPDVAFSKRKTLKCDSHPGNTAIITSAPYDQNIFTFTYNKNSGEVEWKDVKLLNNGFLQLHLMGPVSPDPENPFFTSYTITDMELEYTAQKTWEDSLTRGIDFTTVKKLDFFHGDSIQDLSKKQFRFRRYISPPISTPGDIDIIASQEIDSGVIVRWEFIISYAHAQLIMNNPALFYWIFPAPTGSLTMDQLYGSVGTYGTFWGVYQQGSVWILSLIKPVGNPYFTDISDFNNPFVDLSGSGAPPVYGWVTENNEWRESWKRYGQTEDIRYGLALGKIYHDVQPEALVKIEGNAIGCHFPREIQQFLWRNVTQFLPVRLSIDFTQGRTSILLLESKHSIVTDYVN